MLTDDDKDLDEEVVAKTENDEVEVIDDENDNSEEVEALDVSFDSDSNDDDEDDEDKDDAAHARTLVKRLRKENKKKLKRIKELEKGNAREPKTVVALRTKPDIASYEKPEDFTADLDKWYEEKGEHDAAKAVSDKQQEAIQARWDGKVKDYATARDKLGVDDFEEAEEAVEDIFSVTQQGILMSGAENASLLVYALGKSPKKAAELAAKTDPVQFAFAAAKMEAQLKTNTRRRSPNPDRVVTGRSGGAASSDKILERLEKEADKTGDRSKVIAYKRSLKSKG